MFLGQSNGLQHAIFNLLKIGIRAGRNDPHGNIADGQRFGQIRFALEFFSRRKRPVPCKCHGQLMHDRATQLEMCIRDRKFCP